jgi:hypothetical protein
MLRTLLGGIGSVQDLRTLSNNPREAWLWSIHSMNEILLVIDLINGLMRTPKFHSLHGVINWMQDHLGITRDLLPLDYSPLDSNGWLAGFLEGDGHFEPRATQGGPGRPRRVDINIVMEQRQLVQRYGVQMKPFMDILADFFGMANGANDLSTQINPRSK